MTFENETADNFSDDERVHYYQTYYQQLSEAIE
jgi:DNA/RNA-binding domain of Phe-tRNA-synthetase-like protein